MAAYDQVLAKLAVKTSSDEEKPRKDGPHRRKKIKRSRVAETDHKQHNEPEVAQKVNVETAPRLSDEDPSKREEGAARGEHAVKSSHLARFARRRAGKNVCRWVLNKSGEYAAADDK
jgi:hypothetical protein